jgi:deoxycytidylate deaminase
VDSIQLTSRLDPYFIIAEEVAKRSPCTRRQYGSVIAFNGPEIYWTGECNKRLSACCNGVCARDTFNTKHGQRTEVGAEIHSEVAALIDTNLKANESHFILVGFEKGHELRGSNVYPCHACALSIKYAGYRYIYIKNTDDFIVPISISEILKYREDEWEPDA